MVKCNVETCVCWNAEKTNGCTWVARDGYLDIVPDCQDFQRQNPCTNSLCSKYDKRRVGNCINSSMGSCVKYLRQLDETIGKEVEKEKAMPGNVPVIYTCHRTITLRNCTVYHHRGCCWRCRKQSTCAHVCKQKPLLCGYSKPIHLEDLNAAADEVFGV